MLSTYVAGVSASGPADAAGGSCQLDAYYGDYPGGQLGDVAIYTDTDACKEKVVVRCESLDLVIDYYKPGPDDEIGLHPTETDDIACDDVYSVFVRTYGGDDVVELAGLADFPNIGTLNPEGSEAVQVYLDRGDDTLLGSDHEDYAKGGAGDDRVRGKGADDELLGNDGRDLLVGGPGEDVLVGGPGKDCVIPDGGSACAL